ncbi:MarR family winged helix-turn-helix transcriptional regulator [Neptuniibacter caesariensis]|uniref:Transcriptional regulator, MarR family protein n=1 Tax=Neptuniibacter caesariensis TaxID=207954 RepID=A0A7U8C2K0_NEPCE|nr:MarR family transcriptional regulator [Neptuniibacter caesariensis]EAR60318.1 transcriptional regulator, MarR family protein [Neptuniibacter caesariensis]
MNKELTPQDCIFHLLVKASKAGNRCWKQATADLGLTAVQGKVLNFMHNCGEITASELSKEVAIDNATLTGLLDRLEALELLERHTKSDDRRAILIRLTDQGQTLAEELYQRWQPANEQFLENFSDAETAMLRDMLKRF